MLHTCPLCHFSTQWSKRSWARLYERRAASLPSVLLDGTCWRRSVDGENLIGDSDLTGGGRRGMANLCCGLDQTPIHLCGIHFEHSRQQPPPAKEPRSKKYLCYDRLPLQASDNSRGNG
jgi:hypothetical protein